MPQPLLQLAGPMTGLILQPLIGSDPRHVPTMWGVLMVSAAAFGVRE